MQIETEGGLTAPCPASGRALKLYPAGPFKAKLTPTHLARTSALPDLLYASLLVQGPAANGHGYVESPRTAQDRKPVRLNVRKPGGVVVPHEIRFNVPGGGLVDHLGLFDSQNRLWFFGRLVAGRQRAERPEVFLFPAGSLEGVIRRAGETWI